MDLLLRMRRLQVEANVAEMRRARTMTALFQQLESDVEARRAENPLFTPTPLAAATTETQPVTGQTPGRIRSEIETVLIVDRHLPWLAEHLDSGRLDPYRAKPVIDAFKDDLGDHPEARERFAELMRQWFARAADVSPDLLNKTITQIRNHTHYVVTKVLAGEFDDRFRRRHRSRSVHTRATGDGMGSLTIDTDLVSVKLAEHHVDALARDARSAGDERTLEQLRADLAIDLLTGRVAAAGEERPSEGDRRSAVGRLGPTRHQRDRAGADRDGHLRRARTDGRPDPPRLARAPRGRTARVDVVPVAHRWQPRRRALDHGIPTHGRHLA